VLLTFLWSSFLINEGSAIVYQMNTIFAVSAASLTQQQVITATLLNRVTSVGWCVIWMKIHKV
jgi:MFS-type transporter involved in bile tolerance (Atg22 family)